MSRYYKIYISICDCDYVAEYCGAIVLIHFIAFIPEGKQSD